MLPAEGRSPTHPPCGVTAPHFLLDHWWGVLSPRAGRARVLLFLGWKLRGGVGEGVDPHSLSGTPASSSSSHTVAMASEGARQSPRGDNEPLEEVFGPLGKAAR